MREPTHLFRLYEPHECGPDGYPYSWHRPTHYPPGPYSMTGPTGPTPPGTPMLPAVKDLVRENAENRCLRCGHPYAKGEGEWSPCDALCTHSGEIKIPNIEVEGDDLIMCWELLDDADVAALVADSVEVCARWRILTVHHLLTGPEGKRNLRWWNLVSLCQRCHLTIQRRVDMNRVYPWPHTEWFRPYAAGWYAWCYLGEDLSRAEVMTRLDELLALEGYATSS